MKKIILLYLSVSALHCTFLIAQDFPEMKRISEGSFYMGDTILHERHNTQIRHTVKISPFEIGITPVTVSQWKYYCAKTNKQMPAPPAWGWKDAHPIVNITWAEAIDYTDWLSFYTGKLHRLPTEAEWEYVASEGGKLASRQYCGEGDLVDLGWFHDNCHDLGAKPVAQKKPNAWGIYDMSGNVWEWCGDWYSWYPNQAVEDPKGPTSGNFRIIRGGSWYNKAYMCTIGVRGKQRPANRMDYTGFRVVSPAIY